MGHRPSSGRHVVSRMGERDHGESLDNQVAEVGEPSAIDVGPRGLHAGGTGHRRGLVVEVAPGVVDASADALPSSHVIPDVAESEPTVSMCEASQASASRVARRLVIVSQDLPVHGQPSAATSPEVLHHVNETLADNDSDTASASRASDNREVNFTAVRPARIAGDVVQFDLTVDDGAERVPVVEAGSATPVAQDDDTDHEMGMSEAGSEGVFEFIEEPEANVVVPRVAGLREALLSLDRWHLPDLVKKRACVMRSVPRFLKGPYRNALRVALEEATAQQLCRQERGWKLFTLLPRMLLHRPLRGGLLSKEKLTQRFDAFSHGQWESLLEASARCDEQAAVSRRRSQRRDGDHIERRAVRAKMLVGLGELSSARQALEGASLADQAVAHRSQEAPTRVVGPHPS